MAEKSGANRPLMTVAALLGALGVAGAARGLHGGEGDLSIAANMLLLHAPVLLVVSLLRSRRLMQIAGWVLVVALLLFAGDLAMRDELHHPLFAFAAPVGGGGMIVGWVLLAVGVWVG